MGTSVEQIVETQLKITDHATGALQKVAAQAEHTEGIFSRLFEGMREVAGIGAVVGGALSLHAAWESSERYLKNIKEVKELTGATAGETDLLFSSARKSGVEYETMKNVMFQLSRRGAMLEQSMAVMNGQHLPGMAKKFSRLGVDVTKGPVSAIAQMSDAVKAGKVDVAELMTNFRIPAAAANDFKEFLEKLDKNKLAAAKKGGVAGLLRDQDIENFAKLEKAQHRIADAWNRIKVLVISKLTPVIATMAEKFADRLEGVIPKVMVFADFLVDHMDEIVMAAKTFVAVMTTKKLIDMLEKLSSPAGILGKLATGESAIPKEAGAGMLSKIGPIITTFTRAVPILAAIGAAVYFIYRGYQRITESVDGTRERIMQTFDKLQARWENLAGSLDELWQTVSSIFGGGDGSFGDFIGKLATISFEGLVAGVDFFMHVIRTAAGYLNEIVSVMKPDITAAIDTVKNFIGGLVKDAVEGFKIMRDAAVDLYNWFARKLNLSEMSKDGGFKLDFGWLQGSADLWNKHWKKVEDEDKARAARITGARWVKEAREAAGKRDTPSDRPPGNNFDFRGSRFDITQSFAEGFDPDRIAVAFTNDLASLGEFKSQSGFVPVTSAAR